MAEERCCLTCANWMPVEEVRRKATAPAKGECHRYAPRPAVADRGTITFPMVAWAITDESDFCGEWYAGGQRRRTLRTERPTEKIEPEMFTDSTPEGPAGATE
jgi:hypothetical protein